MTDAELDNVASELIKEIKSHHKEQLEPWMEAQIARVKKTTKPAMNIGGEFTYTLTPTTLGFIIIVCCEPTGERLSLTDFSNW